MLNFQLYCVDTETTGLVPTEHSPIEISICRLSDGSQGTWFLRPTNFETIDAGALRINGYNIDDIKGLTKHGNETFLPPEKVIIEIENWLNTDDSPPTHRIIIGHNAPFDKSMLQELWKKCNSYETFPLSEKYCVDTACIEFFMDYCKGTMSEGYSLSGLAKKYGIKNEKKHTAASDVQATIKLFDKQVEIYRSLIDKSKKTVKLYGSTFDADKID